MPTWADLLGDTPDPEPPEGTDPPQATAASLLRGLRERMATAAAAVVIQRGAPMSADVLTEPPLTVMRAKGYRRNGSPSSLDMVRCVNGGWWVVRPYPEALIPAKGWEWKPPDLGSTVRWTDITRPEDRARMGPVTLYRFDSSEPPPGVVRLRQHPAPEHDSLSYVARSVNGGWHWVEEKGLPCCDDGWPWADGALPSPDTVLVPVYPVIDRDVPQDVSLLEHLSGLLPNNGEWYWIAIDHETSERIWARHDSDGDTEWHVGYANPGAW